MPNDVSILGPEPTLLHAANASGAVNVWTLRQVNVSLCCDSFCERCVIHGSAPPSADRHFSGQSDGDTLRKPHVLAELVSEIASRLLLRLRKRLPTPLHREDVVIGTHGTVVTSWISSRPTRTASALPRSSRSVSIP